MQKITIIRQATALPKPVKLPSLKLEAHILKTIKDELPSLRANMGFVVAADDATVGQLAAAVKTACPDHDLAFQDITDMTYPERATVRFWLK